MSLFQVISAQSTPDRVARAIGIVATDGVLYVERWREGVIKAVVRSRRGAPEHIVLLSEDGSRYKCTCYDYARTGKPCKHILAAAFYIDLMEGRLQPKPPSSHFRESRAHHEARVVAQAITGSSR